MARLGRTYLELKQYEKARDTYMQAIDVIDGLHGIPASTQANYRAIMLHSLGLVAQGQRQWVSAEQYYQQALALYIEYNDRYSQAGIYHNLGQIAQEQRQWEEARDFLLKALAIIIEFNNDEWLAITLRSLARLWRVSCDTDLSTVIASILHTPPPDPYIEAWNAHWKAFEAQDYEGQIALFIETLDDADDGR